MAEPNFPVRACCCLYWWYCSATVRVSAISGICEEAADAGARGTMPSVAGNSKRPLNCDSGDSGVVLGKASLLEVTSVDEKRRAGRIELRARVRGPGWMGKLGATV